MLHLSGAAHLLFRQIRIIKSRYHLAELVPDELKALDENRVIGYACAVFAPRKTLVFAEHRALGTAIGAFFDRVIGSEEEGEAKKLLPAACVSWGSVLLDSGGDRIGSADGGGERRVDWRDNTYARVSDCLACPLSLTADKLSQWEVLPDPPLPAQSKFGVIRRIIEVEFQGNVHLLAVVQEALLLPNKPSFLAFKKLQGSCYAVDLTCVWALLGRVVHAGDFYFIDRSEARNRPSFADLSGPVD